jgi:hypothetical protein
LGEQIPGRGTWVTKGTDQHDPKDQEIGVGIACPSTALVMTVHDPAMMEE